MGADIGRRRREEEDVDIDDVEASKVIECSIKDGFIDMGLLKVPVNTEVTVFIKGRPDIMIKGRIICYERRYGNVLIITDKGTPMIIKYRDIKFINFNTSNYKVP